MKTKWARAGMLAVACIMTITLAACASAPAATKAPESATAAPTTEAAEPTAAPAEKIKLRVQTDANVQSFPEGMDENNNLVINYLREKTGYDLEWIIAPKEGAAEWKSTMMAAGNTPDLMRPTKAEFLSYAQQDMWVPLDDSLAKFGQAILSKVDPETWSTALIDGKKYAITIPTQYITNSGIMYRGDWLEKVGKPVPKTLDEFVAVLTAVRDQKPGGANTVPLVVRGADNPEYGLECFRGAFGVAASDVDDNGVYQDVFLQPGMRSYVEFCRKLYADKIIDPDYPVTKSTNMSEKMAGGIGFMACVDWTSPRDIVKALAEKDPNARMDYISEGPVGADGSWGYRYSKTPYAYLCVPVYNAKNVDHCVDFVNKLTDEETRVMMNYGPKDMFNTLKDGVYTPNEKAAKEFGYNVYYIAYWSEPADFLNRCKTKGFWPAFEPFEKGAINRDLTAYVPLLPDVEANKTDREDLWKEYFLKIVTGAYDMTKFDEFIAKYKELGAEKADAAIQAWYDANMKK